MAKITELERVLMERDGLTREEAAQRRRELMEMVWNGENPEEVLEYEEGLEPDYIFDILP